MKSYLDVGLSSNTWPIEYLLSVVQVVPSTKLKSSSGFYLCCSMR